MEDEQPARPRPRNIGFAVTSAVAIGFTCIVVGQFAEQFAGITPTEGAASALRPQFNAVDFSATGAIKGQTLAPCGPPAKEP